MMTTTFTEILEAKRATLGPKPEKVSVYHALKGGKVTTFTNRNDAYNHSKIVKVETNEQEIRDYRKHEMAVYSEAVQEFKTELFNQYDYPHKFLEKVWTKANSLFEGDCEITDTGDEFEALMDLIVEGERHR